MSVNLNKNRIHQEANESQEYDKQYNDMHDIDLPKDYEQTYSNVPVRERIAKLDGTLKGIQRDLNTSQQDMNVLNSSLEAIRNDALDRNQFIINQLINEKNRLLDDLRKVGKNETDEMNFFKQQMEQLQKDKEKINQTTQSLHLRTQACENDVGFATVDEVNQDQE